jgi:hypothetical protein
MATGEKRLPSVRLSDATSIEAKRALHADLPPCGGDARQGRGGYQARRTLPSAHPPNDGQDVEANSVEILQNVIIPETQHGPSIGFQPCSSYRVVANGLILVMLAAIQLNNQPFIRAGEVNDITGNGNLPAEAEPLKPMGTNSIPEL